MSLIDELMKKVEKYELDEQLKIICDELQPEFDKNGHNPDSPRGPNIFLSVNVPGITNKDLCFICLEREERSKYIVSYWAKQRERLVPCKRTKAIPVNNNKASEILMFFINHVSFMNGE